jgi:hypothetical protein
MLAIFLHSAAQKSLRPCDNLMTHVIRFGLHRSTECVCNFADKAPYGIE